MKILSTIWILLFIVVSMHAAEEPAASANSAHRADLIKRRQAVAKKIGEESMAIFFSDDPKNKTNDVDYEFHQNNNLYYLTGITQEETTLVLIPGTEKQEFIFVKDRNPLAETWTGKILSHEEVTAISGIKNVYSSKQFEDFVETILYQRPWGMERGRTRESHEYDKFFEVLKSNHALIYFCLANKPGLKEELTQELAFAQKLRERFLGFAVRDLWPDIAKMRQIKSDYEIELMRKAVDISDEGHFATWKALKPGIWEYEIEAIMEGVFKQHNADWSYPSIIGSGPNATILHYESSQRRANDGDLVLMDAAAAYDYYSADVTRTVPVNGKFTPEQAAIYQIVYDAQEACFKMVKPGVKFVDLQKKSADVIKEGLKKLGLITDTSGDQYKMWNLHGLGHWIGLDVHDAGDYTLPMQPGMMFTIEPGIYIREDAFDNLPQTPENQKLKEAVQPVYEKYKNIGVRIEDDILVTKNGCEVLSRSLPRKIDEVEAYFRNRK